MPISAPTSLIRTVPNKFKKDTSTIHIIGVKQAPINAYVMNVFKFSSLLFSKTIELSKTYLKINAPAEPQTTAKKRFSK